MTLLSLLTAVYYSKISQGLGVAMTVLSLFTAVYNSVLSAWTLKFLVTSTNTPLKVIFVHTNIIASHSEHCLP